MDEADSALSDLLLDERLSHLTAEKVAHAMQGFALPLVAGKDLDWLGLAVRRALAVSLDNFTDGPERTSNADVRAELLRLKKLTGAAWLELFERDAAVNDRVWDHAWKISGGSGGADQRDGNALGEPPSYLRFQAAVAELDWMSGFLQAAANSTASQGGQWRNSEKKGKRIERGQYLAPIFEAAFGEQVSANNSGNGDARLTPPTPFMDFYVRMVGLAFGGAETSNHAENVKRACKQHRLHPVRFRAGLIPGL